MGDRGHNRHGPKRGGGCCPSFAVELGPRLTQCGMGQGLRPYQVVSSCIQPFGHNRHGPKTGGCDHLTQHRLGRGLPPYQVASSVQPFGQTRHGPKIGWGLCPFLGELGPPSNTKSPGPRPTSIPSGISIHPAVWPQRTCVENWGLRPFRGLGSYVPI